MTFINEFVSDEDIKKYKLQDIWDRYHPFSKEDVNSSFRYAWTIDREKNVFFIPASTGREEYSNRTECIFYWKKVELKVTLTQHALPSVSELGVRWKLKSIRKQDREAMIPCQEILSALRDALSVYGHRGIWRQVDGYKVEFDF